MRRPATRSPVRPITRRTHGRSLDQDRSAVHTRFMSGWARVRCGAGLLLAMAACKSSTAPQGYEALPETAETVQAALDLFTTGDVSVPPNCGGSPAVNCPGGTPGGSVTLALTRTRNSLFQVNPGTFEFSVDLKVLSQTPIPITVPAIGECTMIVDTRPGTDSTLRITGEGTFLEDTVSGDPPNRLVFTTPTITGLTTDDVSIAGGGTCDIANLGLEFFLGTLETAITPPTESLCGAAGPTLFVACPQPPAATTKRR